MAINRSRAARTDLPFLSRRVKPRPETPAAPAAPAQAAAPRTTPAPAAPAPAAPAASASAPTAPASSTPPSSTPPRSTPAPGSLSLSPPPRQAPPTVSTSLSLGLSPNAEAHSDRARGVQAPSSSASVSMPSAASAPAAPAPLYTRLFPAPGISELRSLDSDNPVLRLTPMESAVGSLAVAGTIRAVWEGLDFTTGSQAAPRPGTPAGQDLVDGAVVDTPGNRPLVGYEDDLALIALRHAGLLRRALFFPKPKQPMNVGLYNGESVTIPAAAGPRSFYVLSVLRIGTVLELRAEVIPFGLELKAIWEAFGFTMSTRFPFRGN